MQNKTAFITGAGSGIGRALAIQLAQRQVEVIICDIKPNTLAETQEMIAKIGGKVTSYRLDVSDKVAFFALAEKVIETHKTIDIVINNAGVALAPTTLEKTKLTDFEWIMGINFWGVVYGTQAFLPHLHTRPEAWIINISSVFGLAGIDKQTPYCSAKFAVRGFTEALRMELLGTNITPIVVHPGGIDTNIVRDSRGEDAAQIAKVAANFAKNAAKTTADAAAATIIKGILRKKKKVLIGTDAWVMDRFVRLLPVLYSNIFSFFVKKMGI